MFIYFAAIRAEELCESREGRPRLPSLISFIFSVDVKHRVVSRFGLAVRR